MINLLKSVKPEFVILFTLATGIIMLKLIFSELYILNIKFRNLATEINIDIEFLNVFIKLCFVSFIKVLICDLCNDYGNTFISDKVDFASRIVMLTLCFPWLQKLIVYINKLL